MRNQYKILAEKYNQLQETSPTFDLVDYLVDETEDWQLYLDLDMPYEITYPNFIEFIINDSGFNPTAKNMWDALLPKEKKRIYQKIIHILAKKHGADDMEWYPDPDEVELKAKVRPIYKKAAKATGWDIQNTLSEVKKKKRDPETIPQVLRNIPEIMNDIDGFEKWFFTHTQYAAVAGNLGDGALLDIYHARIEDYNEGEGLEWSEAEYRVEEDFKKWAKEYIKYRNTKQVYKKAAKDTGWDIQNTL